MGIGAPPIGTGIVRSTGLVPERGCPGEEGDARGAEAVHDDPYGKSSGDLKVADPGTGGTAAPSPSLASALVTSV